jgi:hypothetical protein
MFYPIAVFEIATFHIVAAIDAITILFRLPIDFKRRVLLLDKLEYFIHRPPGCFRIETEDSPIPIEITPGASTIYFLPVTA